MASGEAESAMMELLLLLGLKLIKEGVLLKEESRIESATMLRPSSRKSKPPPTAVLTVSISHLLSNPGSILKLLLVYHHAHTSE